MALSLWARDEGFIVNRRFIYAQEDRERFAFVDAPGATLCSPLAG